MSKFSIFFLILLEYSDIVKSLSYGSRGLPSFFKRVSFCKVKLSKNRLLISHTKSLLQTDFAIPKGKYTP